MILRIICEEHEKREIWCTWVDGERQKEWKKENERSYTMINTATTCHIWPMTGYGLTHWPKHAWSETQSKTLFLSLKIEGCDSYWILLMFTTPVTTGQNRCCIIFFIIMLTLFVRKTFNFGLKFYEIWLESKVFIHISKLKENEIIVVAIFRWARPPLYLTFFVGWFVLSKLGFETICVILPEGMFVSVWNFVCT